MSSAWSRLMAMRSGRPRGTISYHAGESQAARLTARRSTPRAVREGQWGTQGDYNLGLLLGLIAGDGHITADRGACVNLWGADQALIPRVAEYVNTLVEGTAQGKRKEYTVQPVAVPDRELTTLRS